MNNESSLAGGHGSARTIIALLTIAVILIAGCAKEPPAAPATAASGESAAEHALKHTDPLYRCPMHPDVVRNEPGDCPICGMALVKVEPEPAVAADAVPPGGIGEPSYYRHPHDPQRTSPTPRKDEMGMDYVPVYAEATGPEVRISPAVINNLGVRTESATLATLPRRAQTVGFVTFDDRRVRQVRPRADGWIEGLSVLSLIHI